jgi:hypothetical protein
MAKSPRFINFSELSDELRHFIEAGAKIFPIDTFESLPNEKTYEFYRVLSGDHKNEIYGWSELDSKYVLIGADDRDIRWDDVQYKPTEFTPINHNHTLLEIIDFPSNMPPSNHTHTENEITDLDKYTKLEIDGALSGKANSVHSHFESDIVDLDKYTKAEIDDALSGKVDKVDGKGLSTNDFTTSDKNKLDSLSENASLNYTSMQEALNNHKTSSDHDGRYYTKTDLDTILSGKADKTVVNGHINSSTIHVTQDDKDTWNSKANSVHTHSESEIIDLTTTLSGKADKTVVSGHTDNTTIHVTQDDKDTWNTVSNKVDNSRVLTDVPIGAKFTDTITTINGKTGVITKSDIVALGIPAQDTIYIHPDTHSSNMITGLATVATSGDYNDLFNRPTLGTVANKNTGVAPGNIPILDANGKLDQAIIPTIAISDTFVINTESAMLALIAQVGDIAVRTDLSKSFILKAEPASTLANWQELLTPVSPVQSVAGKTGVITLSKNDVGLNNVDNTSDLNKPISNATQTALNNKVDNSRVLTDVPAGAKFTDTTYSEITTAEIDAGTSSTRRAISGRRIKYIIDQVSTMISTAIGLLTKSDIGLGNVDNVQQATKVEFNTHNTDTTRHITSEERTKWNTVDNKVDNSKVLTDVPSGAKFTDTVTTINGKTGAISKADIVALGIPAQDTIYNHPSTHPASMITESTSRRFVSDAEKSTWNSKAEISDIPTKVSQLENDKNYVTQSDLGNAGYGDMIKGVYDTNNNGKVDIAEVAETVVGNEIQLGGRFKLVYNDIEDSLDFEVLA